MPDWRHAARLVAVGVGVAVALVLSTACRNPNSTSARQEFRTAILEDQAATVRRWLEAGLDPNEQPTEACSTPLALAVMGGNPEVVRLLVDHGANVNAPASPNGQTVLHCAAALEEDAAEMVEMLLQGGADVNAADDERSTALMLAAVRGHVETVKALLAARPGLEARSSAGKTAVELALAANQTEVVDILRRAGALLALPAAPDEDAAAASSGLTSIMTSEGMIMLGETFEEAQPKLDTGTRLDMKQESPTRTVELRRINNQTYRLTFERDGKTGPYRLVRIGLE
jgi:ankyrin repeat protein